MRFRTHLLGSLAAGLALYPRRPARLAAFVAAGTLIDLDHLLLYSLRTGDWSAVGALRYNAYRHRRARPGDNRPRFGPLRSWLHDPLLMASLCLAGAQALPGLRPVALGLGLHLLLDYAPWPAFAAERLRARGACRSCGRAGGRLYVVRMRRDGRRSSTALCRSCAEAAGAVLPGAPRPPARYSTRARGQLTQRG